MIIKKFTASTEKEAILLAKEELGTDAIVMNIKKNLPKGVYKLFRKPSVEITAAVDEKYANQVINEIGHSLKKDAGVNNILMSMYQKIVLKLGQIHTIGGEGGAKYLFFIGPTGVGKTTTIAKIASMLKMDQKKKIALMTADTYRIAAVEQLTTYANILDIPLHVVYSPEEVKEAKERLKDYDIVLVDTAGRSYKNREQRDDLERLLNSVPPQEREVFLVLSATTKYYDLLRITENYLQITDYALIFTKLDETSSIGNLLNIHMKTGAPLSYATFGQNVPDDISVIDPQNIAKQLLGGSE